MFLFLNREERKLLKEAFLWLRNVVNKKDIILVQKNNRKKFFCFEFPLFPKDREKRYKLSGQKQTFIISFSANEGEKSLGEEWYKIFSFDKFEIWESKNRWRDNPTIRFGLTDYEKKELISLARRELIYFLNNGKNNLNDSLNRDKFPRLWRRARVCVSLWVNGFMRGSTIISGRNIYISVKEAIAMSATDPRFEKIKPEELDSLRIEITLFKEPSLELPRKIIKKNKILPEKGYLAKSPDTGWLLPEALNTIKFRDLSSFLRFLVEKKTGSKYTGKEILKIFEVDDFIETNNLSGVICLYASMPSIDNLKKEVSFKEIAKKTADWLIKIQRKDGSLPGIISPKNGPLKKEDNIRAIFTLLAMAEFGKKIKNEKYFSAAKKGFNYYLSKSDSNPLFISYLGQIAISLNMREEANKLAEKIKSMPINLLKNSIIMASQTVSFLNKIKNDDRLSKEIIEELKEYLYSSFRREKNIERTQYANYAELANVFFDDENKLEEIFSWLRGGQLPNGSFREAVGSNFPYTRGVSKILEVLALNKELNHESLNMAVNWLSSMQYDDENFFFVPNENRELIRGGFRYDYVNPDAWIDSSGHFLLGASRLI